MENKPDRTPEERQIRSYKGTQFRALEPDGKKQLECYFVVFGDTYEIWPGITESIDPHAFDEAISDDIRCLVDHDTAKVLGRTKASTLTLNVDNYGVKGVVDINDNDSDATNLYARVQRGDVSQCSIGFDIIDENYVQNPDGTQHWTIKKVKLYEVSVVTFPAYEKTEAHARDARREQSALRFKEAMKERMKKWHSNS